MSLFINDMVMLTDPQTGQSDLYRTQKLSVVGGKPDLSFRLHRAARIDNDQEQWRICSWKNLKNANPRKVTVDPLGRVSACND